jgi:hypothetical protein
VAKDPRIVTHEKIHDKQTKLVCVECGRDFWCLLTSTRPAPRGCSEPCRKLIRAKGAKAAAAKRPTTGHRHDRVHHVTLQQVHDKQTASSCAECGREFWFWFEIRRTGQGPRYCSDPCRKIARARGSAALFGKPRVERTDPQACTQCGELKPLSTFSLLKNGLRERRCSRCKRKHLTPRAMRNYYLRSKFGITHEEWVALYEGQGGLCAICEDPLPLTEARCHTDHDHKTGKVRGILCPACNHGLGHFRDNPKIARAAANYLDRHRENSAPEIGSDLNEDISIPDAASENSMEMS